MKIITRAPQRHVITHLAHGPATVNRPVWAFDETICAEVKDEDGKTYVVGFTRAELLKMLELALGEKP